jgi:hypothetical protein
MPPDALRDEAGFRRSYDGHVQLLTREGEPVEVRAAGAARQQGTAVVGLTRALVMCAVMYTKVLFSSRGVG